MLSFKQFFGFDRFRQSRVVLGLLFLLLGLGAPADAATAGPHKGVPSFTPAPATKGLVYGITGSGDGGQLVTIDYATGATTVVGNVREFGTGTNFQGIQGLAISSTGEMYGGTVNSSTCRTRRATR